MGSTGTRTRAGRRRTRSSSRNRARGPTATLTTTPPPPSLAAAAVYRTRSPSAQAQPGWLFFHTKVYSILQRKVCVSLIVPFCAFIRLQREITGNRCGVCRRRTSRVVVVASGAAAWIQRTSSPRCRHSGTCASLLSFENING
jgi:hypothetical protein